MTALLAAALMLLGSPPVHPQREWRLGGGFTAVAFTRDEFAGGFVATRTLEIRRSGKALVRFSSRDEGLGVQAADVTGDGVRDLLVLNYQDGSAACGGYRLYGGPDFHELWVRHECADTGVVRILHGDLIAWTAVLSSKTAASGTYPHCCWRSWRQTTWQWQDGRLRATSNKPAHQPLPSYQDRLLPGTLSIR
ncbi:MAG TPA: hypothetical protein VGL76_11215 [Gaiellaceae bacterium]|jgi:hypothetical protein